MTLTRSALGAMTGLQATALALNSAKIAEKSLKMASQRQPNFKKFNNIFIKGSIGSLVGLSLLKPTVDLVNTIQ